MRRIALCLSALVILYGLVGPVTTQAASPWLQETPLPDETPGQALEETPTLQPPTETPVPTATDTPPPPAPTATETQTPEPAVTVRVLSLEPARFNNLAGGEMSIYGTGFLPGAAVRLVGHGLLDGTVVNPTAMKVIIPPGLRKGNYTLEIILPDGTVYPVEQTIRITPPKEPEATATPNVSRSIVIGQPQLVIQSASTEPITLLPGNPFTLSLLLVNRGDYTAANVRLALNSPEVAVPRQGSSLLVVDQMAMEQAVELEMPLALLEGVSPGYQNLQFTIDYSDYTGKQYQSTQSVGLSVSSDAASQPRVILASYTTDPAALSPGDAFNLRLELVNAGKSDAAQLLVTLGGESGLKPFALLGGGNVRFVPRLLAGETMIVEQQLALDGAVEAGVYTLTVSLAYEETTGEQRSETQSINLLVNRRPQIQIGFYRPLEPALIDQSLTLPIEMVNIGRSAINVSTAEIQADGLEITTGSAYIGQLDGGTSGTLDAEVIPHQSGILPVQVTVHYLDDFNQPQVYTHTVEIQVEAPATPAPGEGPGEPGEGGATSLGQRIRLRLRGRLGRGS